MKILSNIKEIIKISGLDSDEKQSLRNIQNMDIIQELESLEQSFRDLDKFECSSVAYAEENGVCLVLGSLSTGEVEDLAKILDKYNVKLNLDNNNDNIPIYYNLVISFIYKNNKFDIQLLSTNCYADYKNYYGLTDISLFAKNIHLSSLGLQLFYIIYTLISKYKNENIIIDSINTFKNVLNINISLIERLIIDIINVIHSIQKMTMSLNSNKKKILESTENFRATNEYEALNEIKDNVKNFNEAINTSKNSCIIINYFRPDTLQKSLDKNALTKDISLADYDYYNERYISSEYISKNKEKVVNLQSTDGNLAIVVLTSDLKKNRLNTPVHIVGINDIIMFRDAKVNIIDLNNNSYDSDNLNLYISLLGKASKLEIAKYVNIETAFTTINLNNSLIKITNQLNEENKKNTELFNQKTNDICLNNSDITNKEQVEFSNKVENIKNLVNNTSNSIVNINGHDDRELAKRLMSIHTNITKILEYSLKLDMKCHNFKYIENEIIAFPLTKVNHRLLKEIVHNNRGVLYLGKDDKGKRIFKPTGIPIINNYMYKGINDGIKEKFEHAELLCPLVVQNYFNSKIYNTVEANLFMNIKNNKFNNFFVLMLVVYRGNILLQLWDRDYFIKQSKKENVKFIKYVDSSSTGLPYIDNIKGDLIKAIGLDSNSSTDNSELKYISGIISLFKVITNKSDYEYYQKDYEESLELVRNAYDRNIRLLNKQIYSKDTDKTYVKFADILDNDELYSRCYKLLSALSTGLLHNN